MEDSVEEDKVVGGGRVPAAVEEHSLGYCLCRIYDPKDDIGQFPFDQGNMDRVVLGLDDRENEESSANDKGASSDRVDIRFHPPMYLQRYRAVFEQLRRHHKLISKVVDIGCSEGGFLSFVKGEPLEIQRVIGLDLDRDVLRHCIRRLRPWGTEGYIRRDFMEVGPLVVELFSGSGTQFDPRLADADAVTLIEVVEHLHWDDLKALIEVVFGRVRPYLVVISTPNADFNAHFQFTSGQMRHPDHKFEMSRAQFQQWCDGIVRRFPCYWWKREDVGALPTQAGGEASDSDLGLCSQIAVFRQSHKRYMSEKPARSRAAQSARVHATHRAFPYQRLSRFFFPSETQFFGRKRRLEMQLTNEIRALAIRGSETTQDNTDDQSYSWITWGTQRGVYVPLATLMQSNEEFSRCFTCLDQLAAFLTEMELYVDGVSMSVFCHLEDVVHSNLALSSSSQTSSDDENNSPCSS